MKISHTLITAALLAGAVAFPVLAADPADHANGVNPPAKEKTTRTDVRREVKEAIDTIKAYSADKRDEALEKSKAALDDFDARMEKQEQRAKENKEKAMVKLKEKRERVAKRYEEFKRATKETWEKAKALFLKEYREMEQEYEEKVDPFLADNKLERDTHDTSAGRE